LLTGIKVAQLSLKHRQEKTQKQRIIVFIGHPIQQEEEDFEELGMRLRRNNVSIDVINFANPENVPKLEALIRASDDSTGNCHFLDVPLGVAMITDVLISSPIVAMDMGYGGEGMQADVFPGGGAPAQAAGGNFGQYGGIDPNLDPELAMALRISLEEERARQN
jgi:26S proteasome regulatory subunit N10